MTTRPQLLQTLRQRFDKFRRHPPALEWATVLVRLDARPAAVKSLQQMEASGGEPDVIGHDPGTGEVIFCDCAAETPSGRRSLCYDEEALHERKENKPAGSALEMARQMGVALLTEAQYRALQQIGEFDVKTSSWIATPDDVRAQGGALFCDRRYGKVFVYHNGAQSYYAARGFRALLVV